MTDAPENVTLLAAMWNRIPPQYCSVIQDKSPLNYSIFEMPEKSQLRAMGVSDNRTDWGANRDHPYGKWSTKSLPGHRPTLKLALLSVEKANRSLPRASKFRIHFADGVQLTLERSQINNPGTLQFAGLYDPNGTFSQVTTDQCRHQRTAMSKKLVFLSNDLGRSTSPSMSRVASPLGDRAISPTKSLATEVLFQHCPPPSTSNVGFSFTPVSYHSYLVKPNEKLKGCRPGLTDTNPQAIQFRPRAFLRTTSPEHPGSCHSRCAEQPPLPNLRHTPSPAGEEPSGMLAADASAVVVDLSKLVHKINNRNCVPNGLVAGAGTGCGARSSSCLAMTEKSPIRSRNTSPAPK